MTETTTVPDMLTALGVIACVAVILAIDLFLGETVFAFLFGIGCIIGIPAWVIGTSWTDRKRQSRQNRSTQN